MNKISFIFPLIIILIVGCISQKEQIYTPNTNINNNEDIRIAWDYSSIQQLADRGGYPRLYRLKDSSIVVVYEDYRGNCALIRSYDEGKTWSTPFLIFEQIQFSDGKERTTINMANPEIIQLDNGDIIVACNYRPRRAEITPFSIAIRRSTDYGKSWEKQQILYEAEPRFKDGCWEPSFLQLPNGELQIYFANEKPYTESDEQEISVMSSTDYGKTWSDIRMVSFRKNRRDGMPVARIINDEIVAVIEDNNKDQFKPYTVRNKIPDNWANPVLSDSPKREYALVEGIPDSVYMGAPYLLVLPSGYTLISYQSNENRQSNWELSTMEVAIGNREARNFHRRTQPFPVPLDKEAKWNSIALWDESTVVALASSNFRSRQIAPHLIKGYIIPDKIVCPEKGKEGANYPLFIGSQNNTNMRIGLEKNKENLYIKCKVNDSILVTPTSELENGDVISIYLDATGQPLLNSKDKTYKIVCSYNGDYKIWKNNYGKWELASRSPIKSNSIRTDSGYEIELSIPFKELAGFNDQHLKFCASLSTFTTPDNGYTETLIHCETSLPDTWLTVEF